MTSKILFIVQIEHPPSPIVKHTTNWTGIFEREKQPGESRIAHCLRYIVTTGVSVSYATLNSAPLCIGTALKTTLSLPHKKGFSPSSVLSL